MAIVFYQNMLAIPVVYGVQVPDEWFSWLSIFRWVNLDFLDVYKAQCLDGVASRLNATALGSLGVVVGMLAVGALHVFTKHVLGADRAAASNAPLGRRALISGMPSALFAVFALVPGVSRSVFRTWSCKKFLANDADGSSIEFLVMQMSVQCYTDEHNTITSLAVVYLIVW